jgi:flavin reductase (DIM6/NTAB) family NADH-FMN oxidoreductase RutF
MISSSQPGDHELIIAEVKNTYVLSEDGRPMVHIRKTGLDY